MSRGYEEEENRHPSLRDPHFPDLIFHQRGLPPAEREEADLWRRRQEMQDRDNYSKRSSDRNYDSYNQDYQGSGRGGGSGGVNDRREERKRWYQNEGDDDVDRSYGGRERKSTSSSWFGSGSSSRDVRDYDDDTTSSKGRGGGGWFGRRGYDDSDYSSRDRRGSRYYEGRLIDVDKHYDDDDYLMSRRGGSTSLMGDNKYQVVCVDGSKSSDRAMHFALENIPRNKKLLLLHGVYTPLTSRIDDHEPELRRMESKYLEMCRRAGRECTFAPFEYSRNKSFSEGICHFARANRSPSIIMGKRDDVSMLRRSIMGSSTSMVMTDCEIPVTIALGKNKKYQP